MLYFKHPKMKNLDCIFANNAVRKPAMFMYRNGLLPGRFVNIILAQAWVKLELRWV